MADFFTDSVTPKLPRTDSLRLVKLINQARDANPINLSPDVQRICDAIIGARPDVMLLVDLSGVIHFATDACEILFGVSALALEGQSFASLLQATDQQNFSQFVQERIAPMAGQSFSQLGPIELRIKAADSERREFPSWVALRVGSVDTLQPADAQAPLFFFSLMDISHREAEEERILQQLNFDALTGLPSRYNLISTVEKHIETVAASAQPKPFVFVFFDLDRFKTVNDALGHRIGDEFLAALCQRLQASLAAEHIFARFGGDEFILFLPTTENLSEALALCLEALDLMRQPINVAGYTLSCGASFGLARYPDHGTTIDGLLESADTAMYHTKSQGFGGCAVYDPLMRRERFSQLQLEQELREALSRDEITAHYQPMVDLATGKVVGVEAFARWNHQRLGMLGPGDFLALAEQAGLVRTIDARVQAAALADAAHWRQQGHDIILSINSSSAQIESRGFLRSIATLCAAMEYPFDRLQIELTEQTLVRQVELAASNIQALRKRGVKVAIDDFGKGYSSLTYLRQFPVDVLKIDQTFIQDIQTSSDAKAGVTLADVVIAMAKGLGLTLIAEGVEHPAQIEYLRQQACDQAQGFLFSEPCDAAQMLKVLDVGSFAKELQAAAAVSAAEN